MIKDVGYNFVGIFNISMSLSNDEGVKVFI